MPTVLAVMAHPDDIEITCAGTLALLATAGWRVHMARMYEMIREPADDELEIFRTLDKAVEWLGLGDELETISTRLTTLR